MKLIGIFIIILLVLVIPSATAQEMSIGEKANQKSIIVTINESGEIHVIHIIDSSKSPKQVELIDGEIQNLTITNENSEEQMFSMIGENQAVLIFPSDNDSIIEYDLENVLFLNDNLWTLNFLYLESTTFIVPEKLNVVYVNSNVVYLDKEKGFTCHGCQMILEYAFDEPTDIIDVNWENKEFVVEMRTFANIENFEFNQSEKEISFNVNEGNQFITTIIPLELLWGPYAILLDDETTYFNDSKNNGTHVWINMKPNTAGEINIIGTTVVPEFPIIAPLAIGFLVIMIVPLIRKINLH